ncbi:MAG: tetratricopeptide repeat protein [Nevskia sp.]|nr:tetratricopeptide repeat protein [Nevskia sp.]
MHEGCNEDGTFEDLDRYADLEHPGEVAAALAGDLSKSGAQVAPAASAAQRQRALTLNRDGEAAYARHDYEAAIGLFQQAVEADPGYGQAYSNLGLSFQKAGDEAEAIWADRKALVLASGPDAARVRASTWFNIARIYEAKSEWAKARDSYRAAENEKDSDVYLAAIRRVEQKLR